MVTHDLGLNVTYVRFVDVYMEESMHVQMHIVQNRTGKLQVVN